MPEGPEVKRCTEVIKDSIGGNLLAIKPISGKIARVGVKGVEHLTFPVSINKIFTRGKIIFIKLEGSHSIISTLGMSGWWYPPTEKISSSQLSEAYYQKVIDTIEKAQKHARLELVSTNGSVFYVDPRNFGNFSVVSQEEFQTRMESLGVDCLNDEFIASSLDSFRKKKNTNRPIGEVLLDQSVIAGLGNIYRAETLYLAGISPHRTVSSITDDSLLMIQTISSLVLTIAYQHRGSMQYPIEMILQFMSEPNKNKLNAIIDSIGEVEGIRGHLAYGRRTDIMNHAVVSDSIGGRTAWWVPEIQH